MEEAAAHNHNKIILNLMIKNESKIIERCLGRALEHVDAVSILDTGSTDNTIELCEQFLIAAGKPFKIFVEPFKNFGYNRTVSFQKAREFVGELGWNLNNTWALAIDADMVIRIGEGFRDFKMKLGTASAVAGYTVMQQNGNLKYYNTRFMRCSYDWKCIGATHEYWSGDPIEKVPIDIFYIEDVNDGGCKSDKTERDIRLLGEDLKTDPTNGRAMFYLAQSLRDLGKYVEAVEHYKRRIEVGGWHEEIWYSHYQIARCYESLGMADEMELWANKAFKLNPRRAEPIYLLTKYFRIHSEHYKGYHYYLKGRAIPYPKNDALFIESSVYDGLFEYENTILANYIHGKGRLHSLKDIIEYINVGKYHIDNVWSNLEFYVDILTTDIYGGTAEPFMFPDIKEYHPSSSSIIPWDNGFIMNIRYVNYIVDSSGYHSKSADGIVRTINAMVKLDGAFEPVGAATVMSEEAGTIYPCNIMGLEDIRLFGFGSKIYFSASNRDRNSQTNFRIVVGEYTIGGAPLDNLITLEPPPSIASLCEKNWIYIPGGDKLNFIYKWHPLEIGTVDENNVLQIHSSYSTPRFFSRIRGSSPICEYDGRLWCVVHIVKHTKMRIYFHSIIGFNLKSMKPERYTLPFCFSKIGIEYCLGFHIHEGVATCIVSENDSSPTRISIPFSKFKFLNIVN